MFQISLTIKIDSVSFEICVQVKKCDTMIYDNNLVITTESAVVTPSYSLGSYLQFGAIGRFLNLVLCCFLCWHVVVCCCWS